jgi:hypothetical protein
MPDSDDVEDLDTGTDGVEATLKYFQLPVASATLNFGVESRRSFSDAVKPIHLLSIGLAFDLMLAGKVGLDHPLHQSVHCVSHDCRAGFGHGL